MARTPYATEIHNTPQKSARVPSAGQPSYIVIHHAATLSFDAVVAMENGGKQVSSTVVIKDGRVASMFDESYRAWSLSSQYWDSVSLSSETCNSEAAPGWPISEASYVTLSKVVADWCRRYNIPCNRERIMGHREVYSRYGASYATACPGGIDMDRVVRDANFRINAGTAGDDPKPIVNQTGDTTMRYFWAPSREGMSTTESDGVFYPANVEEAQALSKAYNGLDITTREWDVLRQAALNRQNAAGKADYTDAITKAINEALDEALKDATFEVPRVDAAELAAAVREKFRSDPLG